MTLESTKTMTCPRRINELGPWEHEPGLDYWTEDETCSFCGGLKPDKVFALIEEGSTMDPTNKMYKVYLSPGNQKVYLQHFTFEQVSKLVTAGLGQWHLTLLNRDELSSN